MIAIMERGFVFSQNVSTLIGFSQHSRAQQEIQNHTGVKKKNKNQQQETETVNNTWKSLHHFSFPVSSDKKVFNQTRLKSNAANSQASVATWLTAVTLRACEIALQACELQYHPLLKDIKVYLRGAGLEWASSGVQQRLLESAYFLSFLHGGWGAAGRWICV